MKNILLFFSAILLTTATLFAESAKARADRYYQGCTNIVRDLQYKSVGNFDDPEQLSLDLILPEQNVYPGGAPVVLYIHGGGWSGGERYVLAKDVFKKYTGKGIAVACVSYRLAQNGNSGLECLIDCKDAARFLAKEAKKYGLDPSRFGATGHSAGGHLSLCTALIPNDAPLLQGDSSLRNQDPVFVCVSALAPVVTLFHPEEADSEGTVTMNPKELEKIIGAKSAETPTKEAMASDGGREHFISTIQTKAPAAAIARLLSPEFWLKKTSPPILIIHGKADNLVSVRGTRYFQKLANDRRAKVSSMEIENGGHDFRSRDPQKTPSQTPQEMERMCADFLIKNLLSEIQPNSK